MLKKQREIDREKSIYKVGIFGILLNILLFVVKFWMGVITSSVSIVVDAFNNLSDVASAVISIVGTKLAEAPPDADHPLGHGRLEYIAGMFISFIVALLGFTFLKTSISKIFSPEELNIVPVVFVLLIISVLIKLYIYKINMDVYDTTKAPTLKATALDAKGDALITVSIIISIIFYRVTGLTIDGIIGCFIAINIIKSGIELLGDTINPLIGEAPCENKTNDILTIISEYEEVKNVHDLIIHNYGVNKSVASIHAEISSSLNAFEMHEILDDIEEKVKYQCGIDLVIHADPLCEDPVEISEALEELDRVIKKLNNRFLRKKSIVGSFENFRVVGRGRKKSLVFEMVLSFDENSAFNNKKEKNKNKFESKVTEYILKELRVNNPKYNCSIYYKYEKAEV